MTEDAYMDEANKTMDAVGHWTLAAGTCLGATPSMAVVFIMTHEFVFGAATITALFVAYVCIGRSYAAGSRILTEMKELNDIVQSVSAGEKPAGGPQQETALRPVNAKSTVHYFNDEIARIK